MDAPFCKQFLEVLAPALSGPFKLDHVIFSSPTIGLDYPVTENRDYYFDLEGAPENLACVVEILFEIAATIKNLFVFWPTRNDENRYRALCGTGMRMHRSWGARWVDLTHSARIRPNRRTAAVNNS